MNPIILKDMQSIAETNRFLELLKNKTLLISGANGFLPAYMVQFLLYLNTNQNAGIKVIALVRNLEKAKTRFKEFLLEPGLKFLVQDVTSPIEISETIHFIVHAASQASPKFYGIDPVGTCLANTQGTINMLNLAKEKKVESFLYFSSGEVYGTVDDSEIPISEDTIGKVDPLNLRSCYAESKRAGENMSICWFHQFGVPAKIVRPFHTYGPGLSLDDGRIFADFISDVVHGRNIQLKSDGSATRGFCYLADATVGFFAALLLGKNGEAYNIGGSREISMKDLADIMSGLFPEKKLKVIRTQQTNNDYLASKFSRVVPSISKAKDHLNWEPQISVEEGFRRAVLSFEGN